MANGVVLLPRKGYRSYVPFLAPHGIGGAEASGLVFLKAKPPPAAAQGFWIAVRMRHGRSMRVAGWVLLVGGFLLCVSILSAALGFLLMGFGLIFLQIAEQKDKSPTTSHASRSGQSEPERAPPPPRALAASQAEEAREVVDRESAVDPNSYDRERWRLLLRNDADISRLVTALAPYGQKYVDELAAAYLALNDKDDLPMILREIIASARRDSWVASDLTDKNSNVEADGLAVDRTRRVDRVRDSRVGYADGPVSVNNGPKVEETNLKPPGAHRESNVSQAGQIAVEATNPEPPAVADAAVGADEKRVTREVDAVDADNLTDMLNRLSQDRPPKIE